ncbi:hypothetical protein [Phytoactinopolyspora halophila]|nr:hypothetical protein [Phytoactinopolyspora halophila]
MDIERRNPEAMPVDPTITADLQAADQEARREFAERGAELLERLRRL